MAYCDRCERYFVNDNALYQHEQNSAYHNVCDTCDRDFTTATGLIQHYVQSRRHHYCQRCDRHFKDDNGLTNHRDAVHYYCGEHTMYFNSAEGLRQHYIQSGDHYYCTLCDERFDDEDDYLDHGDDEHCVCRDCVRIFESFNALANHNECSHHYCRDCDRRFQTEANLRSHRQSRLHAQSSVACPGYGCGKNFVSVSALLLHAESNTCSGGITRTAVNSYVARIDKRNVITNPSRMITGPDGTTNAPSEPEYWATARSWNGSGYECFLCHYEFSSLRALNAHLQSPRHRARIYRCPKQGCGIEYSALSSLCQHVEQGSCGVSKFRAVQDTMAKLTSGMRAIAL